MTKCNRCLVLPTCKNFCEDAKKSLRNLSIFYIILSFVSLLTIIFFLFFYKASGETLFKYLLFYIGISFGMVLTLILSEGEFDIMMIIFSSLIILIIPLLISLFITNFILLVFYKQTFSLASEKQMKLEL